MTEQLYINKHTLCHWNDCSVRLLIHEEYCTVTNRIPAISTLTNQKYDQVRIQINKGSTWICNSHLDNFN